MYLLLLSLRVGPLSVTGSSSGHNRHPPNPYLVSFPRKKPGCTGDKNPNKVVILSPSDSRIRGDERITSTLEFIQYVWRERESKGWRDGTSRTSQQCLRSLENTSYETSIVSTPSLQSGPWEKKVPRWRYPWVSVQWNWGDTNGGRSPVYLHTHC